MLSNRRWHGFVGVLGLVLTISLPAQARWKNDRDVVHNTAHMLDPGEFMIGVFTPIHYGVTESFSVGLHPIFELLLTPNVSARYQILAEPVALTLAGSYVQTFIRELDEGGGFPGVIEGSLLASFSVGRGVTLTPSIGYFLEFATKDSEPESNVVLTGADTVDFATRVETDGIVLARRTQGVTAGLGLNWIATSGNLLIVQGSVSVDVDSGNVAVPQGLLMWAFAWDRTRLGVGAALGGFPIRTGTEELLSLPIYPVIDFWIRL